MLIRLDMSSAEPIYAQIAEALRSQIESGSIAAGDRLPAARSLAGSLGVNLHTVLKAYSELDSESLVEMKRGRGGVIVRGPSDVDQAVDDLVAVARGAGFHREDLIELIEEKWK